MDINVVNKILSGRWGSEREQILKLLLDPVFHYQPGLTVSEHRERVLHQIRLLSESGLVLKAFPEEYGGESNYGGHVAVFEELIVADPNVQIKSGVQFGLFAAAIQHLGTKYHKDMFLEDAMSLKMLGSYGMTESGHGSDVFNIKTTAVFDAETDEFVVNTPDRTAWKDYLGNAAEHGRWVVLFAQMIINNVNHGVHAFIMRTRTDDGAWLPGVKGEDDGVKGGLNGIDNGRLCFNNVRIPRVNLLNRYGDVTSEGVYISSISNPKRRFFVMLGTLVQGRVSLDGGAVAATKLALQVAVSYANRRTQFMNSSSKENLLMSYQTHQARLLPLLAETYAAAFAHEELLINFDKVFKQLDVSGSDEVKGMQSLETDAAAMKSSNTWHALKTLQEAREACGGNGFLQENHIVQLKSDFDIYVTFEGDNTVLTLLVGKRLLADYGAQFKNVKGVEKFKLLWNHFKLIRNSPANAKHALLNKLYNKNNIEVVQNANKWLMELAEYKVNSMVAKTVKLLKGTPKLEVEEVLNNSQLDIMFIGESYAELFKLKAFIHGLHKNSEQLDSETLTVLTKLCTLYGLVLVQKSNSFHVTQTRLSKKTVAKINDTIKKLFKQLTPYSQNLVDSFGYKPEHLRASMLET